MPQPLEERVRDLDISGPELAQAVAACTGLAVHDVEAHRVVIFSPPTRAALGRVAAAVSPWLAVAEGRNGVPLAAAAP